MRSVEINLDHDGNTGLQFVMADYEVEQILGDMDTDGIRLVLVGTLATSAVNHYWNLLWNRAWALDGNQSLSSLIVCRNGDVWVLEAHSAKRGSDANQG